MNKTLRRVLYLGLSATMICSLGAGITLPANAKTKAVPVRSSRQFKMNRQKNSQAKNNEKNRHAKVARKGQKRNHKATVRTKRRNRRGRRIVRRHRSRHAVRKARKRTGNLKTVRLATKQTHDQAKALQLLQDTRYAKAGLNDLISFYRSNHRNADHTHADVTFGAVRIHGRNYLITFNGNRSNKNYGAEYLYRFNPRLTFQSDRGFNRKDNVKPNDLGYVYRDYRFGKQAYRVNVKQGSVKHGRRTIKPIVKVMTITKPANGQTK